MSKPLKKMLCIKNLFKHGDSGAAAASNEASDDGCRHRRSNSSNSGPSHARLKATASGNGGSSSSGGGSGTEGEDEAEKCRLERQRSVNKEIERQIRKDKRK